MSRIIDGLKAMDEALPAYLEAEHYFDGSVAENFMSDVVRRALGTEAQDFSFNYARLVVTSRLDRMEVSSVTTPDDAANRVLEDLRADNQLDQEIQDALQAALTYGDSYLIAFPNAEGKIDVFFNDPKNTRVFYDVENPRKKSYAMKRWMDGELMRVNIYTTDAIEKYISKGKPTTNMVEQDFEPYIEDGQESWPLPNETGTIPVFHFRTARMYGRPEHATAYSAQNAITKVLNVQISGIDYNTFPQRYFLRDPLNSDGVDPARDFGKGGDPDDFEDDAQAKLKAGPGGVWDLKGIKQVGQFDISDPSVFIEPFKTYVDSISATTQTPMHLFQVGSLPSGESLRAAEAPLNKRVESLELLFGSTLREMNEFALEQSGYPNLTVSVQWAPPASYDDADLWENVNTKTAAGVPLRVALMEAGYTAEQVDEWYPEGTMARSATELAAIADSIQKLGAATTMGLISVEEARNLLPQEILIAEVPADLDVVLGSIEESGVSQGDDIKAKAEALGVLIRAGVEPTEAAERVGLTGIEFTGATPSSLRLPTAEAAKLEEA